MAEPKKETKQKITNVDKDVEKLETSYIVGGIRKWCSSCAKLKKLKLELPYNPVISFLGIYPREMKILTWKDTCTPLFIAALFTIAKTWKPPKCPLVDDWIEMWYIYTMEYYLDIKKKEILPFVTTQMDLEGFMLSEVS